MWRHGDVFVDQCSKIPDAATKLPHCILAKGEITGHAHRVKERGVAELFRSDDAMFLRVTGDTATLIHEEHAPIVLGRGSYRVWIQREYSPQEIRRVID